MAFATREGIAVSEGRSTSADMDMPASIVVGERLTMIISVRAATIGTVTGWTSFVHSTGSNTEGRAFWRLADGTEGASASASITPSGDWAGAVYRHSNAGVPEGDFAFSDADEADANPPSLTPTGGAQDYVWIATAFQRGDTNTDTYPTSYVNTGQSPATYSNRFAYADRENNTATEDPSTFTFAAGADWTAFTIAVPPSAAASGRTMGSISGQGGLAGSGGIVGEGGGIAG